MTRTGLYIRGSRGHPEVRKAYIKFAKWLRRNYDFPIQIPVYLLPGKHVITQDRDKASASFFEPYDRNVEPYIRVATGDYVDVKKKHGRYPALASFLCSFAHEIIHYFQWVETGKTWEKDTSQKALRLFRKYEKTVNNLL